MKAGIYHTKFIETPFALLQKNQSTIEIITKKTWKQMFLPDGNSDKIDHVISQSCYQMPHAYSMSIAATVYTVSEYATTAANERNRSNRFRTRYFISKTPLETSEYNSTIYHVFRLIDFDAKEKLMIKCEKIGLFCNIMYDVSLSEELQIESDYNNKQLQNILTDLPRMDHMSLEILNQLNSDKYNITGKILNRVKVEKKGTASKSQDTVDLEENDKFIYGKSAEIVHFFHDHVSIYVELPQNNDSEMIDSRYLEWFDYRSKLQSVCDVSLCIAGSIYVPPSKDETFNNFPIMIPNRFTQEKEKDPSLAMTTNNTEEKTHLTQIPKNIMSDRLEFFCPITELIHINATDENVVKTNKIYADFCKSLYRDKKNPMKIKFNSFLTLSSLNYDFPCNFMSKSPLYNNDKKPLKWNSKKLQVKKGNTIQKIKDLAPKGNNNGIGDKIIETFNMIGTQKFTEIKQRIENSEDKISEHYQLNNFMNEIFGNIMQSVYGQKIKKHDNTANTLEKQHIIIPQYCNIITASVYDYNFPIQIITRTNIRDIDSFDTNLHPVVNIPIYTPFQNIEKDAKTKIKSTIIIYNLKNSSTSSDDNSKDYILLTSQNSNVTAHEINDIMVIDRDNYLKEDPNWFVLREMDYIDETISDPDSTEGDENEDVTMEDKAEIDRYKKMINKKKKSKSYIVTDDTDVHILLGSSKSKLMISAVSFDVLDDSNVFQYQTFLDYLNDEMRNLHNQNNAQQPQEVNAFKDHNISIDSDVSLHKGDGSGEFTVNMFWKYAIWELKHVEGDDPKVYFALIESKYNNNKSYIWIPVFQVENVFFLEYNLLYDWGYVQNKKNEEIEIIDLSIFHNMEDGFIKKNNNDDFKSNLFLQHAKKMMPIRINKNEDKRIFYFKDQNKTEITFWTEHEDMQAEIKKKTVITKKMEELIKEIKEDTTSLHIQPNLQPHQIRDFFKLTEEYKSKDIIYNNIYGDLKTDISKNVKEWNEADNTTSRKRFVESKYIIQALHSISTKTLSVTDLRVPKTDFKSIINKAIKEIEKSSNQDKKNRVLYTQQICNTSRTCLNNSQDAIEMAKVYYPIIIPGKGDISIKQDIITIYDSDDDEPLITSKESTTSVKTPAKADMNEKAKSIQENFKQTFGKTELKDILQNVNFESSNDELTISIDSRYDYTQYYATLFNFLSNYAETRKILKFTEQKYWNKSPDENILQDTQDDFTYIWKISKEKYTSSKICDAIEDIYQKYKRKGTLRFKVKSLDLDKIFPDSYGVMYSISDERHKFEWMKIIYRLIQRSITEHEATKLEWSIATESNIQNFEGIADEIEFMHSSFIDEHYNFLISEFKTGVNMDEKNVEQYIKDIISTHKHLIRSVEDEQDTQDGILVWKKDSSTYTALVVVKLPLYDKGETLMNSLNQTKSNETMHLDSSENMEVDSENVEVDSENVEVNSENVEVSTIQDIADAWMKIINKDMEKHTYKHDTDDVKQKVKDLIHKNFQTEPGQEDEKALTINFNEGTNIEKLLDKNLLRQLEELSNSFTGVIKIESTDGLNQRELWSHYMDSALNTFFPQGDIKIDEDMTRYHYTIKKSMRWFEPIPWLCNKSTIQKNFNLISMIYELPSLKNQIQTEIKIENSLMSIPSLNIIASFPQTRIRIIIAQTCTGWDIIQVEDPDKIEVQLHEEEQDNEWSSESSSDSEEDEFDESNQRDENDDEFSENDQDEDDESSSGEEDDSEEGVKTKGIEIREGYGRTFKSNNRTSRWGSVGVTLKTNEGGGVVVSEMIKGGAADKSGVMLNDTVVEVDGINVEKWNTLTVTNMLEGHINSSVSVNLRRKEGDKERIINVKMKRERY